MRAHRKRILFAAALVLTGFPGARARAYLPDTVVRGVVHRWAEPSARVAHRLLDEYGLPDDVTPQRLVWNGRGSWKRTVVWNRAPVYRSLDDLNVVQQTVDYPLSPDLAARLLAFRGSLVVDLQRGELSSRAQREEVNYLTLNLADDIARERKTVEEAQASYRKILALEVSGKSSPYMSGLLFGPRTP